MGCCGRKNKKVKNTSNDIQSNSTKKINVNNEKEKKTISIDKIQSPTIVNQKQVLQTEPIVIKDEIEEITKATSAPIVPNTEDDFKESVEKISSKDHRTPIKTYSQLQKSVAEEKKPVSILVFHADYCPYSKRTLPGLRRWAQANQDRIGLYEIDVEQDSNLAEYYHVRTIPTIMAFDEQNLIAPIWQRTSKNVLPLSSTEQLEPIEDKFEKIKDVYVVRSSKIQEEEEDSIESVNESQQEQESSEFINDSTLKSVASSEHSSYLWNQSSQSIDTHTSKVSIPEYRGRMISQSTIAPDEQFRKKRTWSEYLNENRSLHDYNQHIHLPDCHEIFYQKQFETFDDFTQSISSDRFSTLTYQQVKDSNNPELCILFLGPNRNRGFEDNHHDKHSNPSKFSLITLQSQLASE